MAPIREDLARKIKEALGDLGVAAESIHLEHPEVAEHGDYSTNVALQYAKESGKNPRELADALAEKLRGEPDERTEKIEVAGAGFINFYLSSEFFAESLKEILEKKDEYGKNEELAGKKIIIEYTDPNPFKEFHIGHLMSNAIGESLSRLIEFSGAEVKRANYQGDVGLHIAYAVAQMEEEFDAVGGPEGYRKNEQGKYLSDEEVGRKVFATYAKGVKRSKEDEEFAKKAKEINRKIYDKTDKKINLLYDFGIKASLRYLEVIYKILGTHFDFYFFESESGPFGKKIVEENTPKIFEKSDGAVIFHGEKYGLHTRVFINSEGLPTYEAKELGLAKMKYEKYPYDISFVVTGNEVRDYFAVVHKAMGFIFPELAEKTRHLTHGMLRLQSGKMSSRTGEVITAEQLIEEAKKLILEKMRDADVPDKEKVAEEVAIGAIKYSILKNAPGNDIIFDFDTSLSFEGSSGPYLQYTHARARSVLAKAENRGTTQNIRGTTQKVTDVERLLYQFGDVVSRAREENAPQYVATYLTELAQEFNNFYARERIVDASEDAPYRLALTEATATVLKNGLWILGIKAPERM